MNFRIASAAAAAACAALLGYAYYLQYVVGLNPCPLCLVQRGFFYAVMAAFALAALHPHRIYPGFAALFALGGIAAAGRQVWLQHLPPERVPACGPDLYFMLENFPLTRTLSTLIKGTGECAAVDWTFLGLSIAEWSLLWFIALLVLALWLVLKGRKHLPHQYQGRAAA
jgi:disulfide bond formation protein DsbB